MKVVDARGLVCPLPVVNTKKTIEDMDVLDNVKVIVDNEIAVQNLMKFVKVRGYESSSVKISDNEFEVVIVVSGEIKEEEIVCHKDKRLDKMCVVLPSVYVMGGDPMLGRILMKSFIFALTKQDVLPEKIICYNRGAYLTVEGSESLEDLKTLEAQGVEILTCGTCLDFYGLKGKLAVGTVTNMYEIVEILEKASHIVKP